MAKTALESLTLTPVSRWFTREIRDLYTAIESDYRTRTEVTSWPLGAAITSGGVPNTAGNDTVLDFGVGVFLVNGHMHTPGVGVTGVDLIQPALTAPTGAFTPVGMIQASNSAVVTAWVGLAESPTFGGTDTVDVALVLMDTDLAGGLTAAPHFLGVLGITGAPRANGAPATVPTGLEVKTAIARIPALANSAWCLAGSYDMQITGTGPNVFAQANAGVNGLVNNPANT